MNLSENIDDKIKNRLLKYYLCWFEQRDREAVACTNYLYLITKKSHPAFLFYEIYSSF